MEHLRAAAGGSSSYLGGTDDGGGAGGIDNEAGAVFARAASAARA